MWPWWVLMYKVLWCRSLGDLDKQTSDAIFIHVCDLRASTCGLDLDRGHVD